MSTDNLTNVSLFAAYKAGSSRAFEQLIIANRGLAMMKAKEQMKRAKAHGWDEGDVYGAANEGLCRAALSWEPEKGAFSTHACPIIMGAIQTGLRLPRRIHAKDSIDSPCFDAGDGGHTSLLFHNKTTLGDMLPSDWMDQIELLTQNPNEPDLLKLAGEFAKLLQGRERDIFEAKVVNQHRDITPEMLGCNNNPRVSQIRRDLIERFRAFVSVRAPGAFGEGEEG